MSAYDLRVYDVADGQLETLERVLREVALPLMPDHGMEAVGFWAEAETNRLFQVSRHASREAVEGNWDRLHADPRWLEGLKARRGETSAVERVVTTFLTGVEGLPPEPARNAG